MPARGALWYLLRGDSGLRELGLDPEAVYHANTVDSPPQARFLIIKHDGRPKSFGLKGADRLTIWAHHKDGLDYGEFVDPALERVKELLAEAAHLVGEDGVILTATTWNSDGPDLVDGGYDTITRWSDFDAVSR